MLTGVAELRGLGGVENVTDLRELGAQNVTMLDTQTEFISYTGEVEVDGQRTVVVISIAVVDHESDVVVAVGVHEATLDETETHAALVEQVVHEDGD